MTIKSIAAAAAIVAFGSMAQATTLGFNGASFGSGDQTFTESGYLIETIDGSFYGGSDNADGGLEYERLATTSGFMRVSRAATFSFDSLDWQLEYGSSATITVEGFLGAVSLGVDSFTSASLSYATFSASALAGAVLDSLVINAERGSSGGSLDALVVSDAVSPVPLPASALLLIGGLGGLAAMRRRT